MKVEGGTTNIITAGVDTGMDSTKALILKGEELFEFVILPGGRESTALIAERALSLAADKANLSVTDIDFVVATGEGRNYVNFANQSVPEAICLAKGIDLLLPTTRTLLDLGARKSLSIKCGRGRVTKMSASNKCASGSGAYLGMVANILGTVISEMSDRYFESKQSLEIQATCSVFAETEIISLLHDGAKTEDIISGVFKGMAERVYSQLLSLGVEKPLAAVGGIARSKAMIAALEGLLGFNILVPENPEMVGSLGAALIAKQKWSAMS